MRKRWFGVAAVTAAALGCAMAAENVESVNVRSDVAPRREIGALDRAVFTNRSPLIASISNILEISAAPIPNDLAGVKAEQEKVQEAQLTLARRQIDMQVAGTQQMQAEREAHDRRSASDPETAKLRTRLVELDRERQDIMQRINERLEKDPEYLRTVKQRQDGLAQLRDMSGIISGLQDKQEQLLRRQAELERQAALAATNQTQSATPAVTIRQ